MPSNTQTKMTENQKIQAEVVKKIAADVKPIIYKNSLHVFDTIISSDQYTEFAIEDLPQFKDCETRAQYDEKQKKKASDAAAKKEAKKEGVAPKTASAKIDGKKLTKKNKILSIDMNAPKIIGDLVAKVFIELGRCYDKLTDGSNLNTLISIIEDCMYDGEAVSITRFLRDYSNATKNTRAQFTLSNELMDIIHTMMPKYVSGIPSGLNFTISGHINHLVNMITIKFFFMRVADPKIEVNRDRLLSFILSELHMDHNFPYSVYTEFLDDVPKPESNRGKPKAAVPAKSSAKVTTKSTTKSIAQSLTNDLDEDAPPALLEVE